MLTKFGMSDSKAVQTPLTTHFKISIDMSPKIDGERKSVERILYASAVGSLMYVMVCTRPDLAYSTNLVSRFMSNSGKDHWDAMKWIFQYVKGALDVGLLYKQCESVCAKLVGYVDTDFAGDLDNRRSLTSYVFTLFG